MSQFGKKSPKVYYCLYSSTEELQMALWACIFFRLGFNNDNLYSHPPSQISPSPISPSLVLPLPEGFSVSSPWAVWWIKQKEWLFTICFADFKRAGQKVEGILLFVPLQRFYSVLFVPLFCPPREKCGTMWKTTWRHNVDNMRQKDIKTFMLSHDGVRLGLEKDTCWQERLIPVSTHLHLCFH